MATPAGDDPSVNELLEAHDNVYNDSLNHMASMALRCALELGIPDVISNHETPVTLSDLVAELSIPPAKSSNLGLIMRLLVHMGYFAVQTNDNNQDVYALTSLSKLFVSSSNIHHPTLTPSFLMKSDPVLWMPSFFLAKWLRGPQSTAFETVHGVAPYEYLKKDLEFGSRFRTTNALESEAGMRGLLPDLIPKLEGYKSLVHVRGCNGAVASIIFEAMPHLRCTVFDLPEVISDIDWNANSNSNISFAAGDAFERIPSADILFFKNTLNSFNDEECLKILKRSYEVIQQEENRGKVIIIDTVRDQKEATFESIKLQLCIDVAIMALGGAEVRTETEWKNLFQDVGFTNYKITPTFNKNFILEVFP